MKLGSSACLIACASLLILGCGPGGPATVPVSGTITKGGQGLPGVSVSLVDSTNPSHVSTGISDAQGKFTLSYGSEGKKGAVPGKYRVVLTGGGPNSTPSPTEKQTSYGGGGNKNAAPVIQTPYDSKWTNSETTPMADVEVKSGMPPLDIKVD